jgi:hypothetical protein
MKKYLGLILAIITSAHAYGMEMEVENYLFKCSTDVLDLIASFLPFEDIEYEQEFIERTKELTPIEKIPVRYIADLPSHDFKCEAYCPNNKLLVLLEKNEKNSMRDRELIIGAGAAFIIIDTGSYKKDTKNYQKKFYNSPLSKNNKYSNIAISRNGDMLATLHSERYRPKNCRIERLFYKNVLTIINVATSTTESHDILDYFELSHQHPTIAFNKEGTHIIIHGNDCTKHLSYNEFNENTVNHHMIIPLTVNTPHSDIDNKKTLEKYFKKQMICKELNK